MKEKKLHGDEVVCTHCNGIVGYRSSINSEPVLMLHDYVETKDETGATVYLHPPTPRGFKNNAERDSIPNIRGARRPSGYWVPERLSDADGLNQAKLKTFIEELRDEVRSNGRPIKLMFMTKLVHQCDLPAKIQCRHCGNKDNLPPLRK